MSFFSSTQTAVCNVCYSLEHGEPWRSPPLPPRSVGTTAVRAIESSSPFAVGCMLASTPRQRRRMSLQGYWFLEIDSLLFPHQETRSQTQPHKPLPIVWKAGTVLNCGFVTIQARGVRSHDWMTAYTRVIGQSYCSNDWLEGQLSLVVQSALAVGPPSRRYQGLSVSTLLLHMANRCRECHTHLYGLQLCRPS